MEISLLGFVLGLLLLALPLYILYVFDPRTMRRLVASFGTMAASVIASGAALYVVVKWNNTALTILSGMVMAVLSAVLVIRKSRLRIPALIIPVASGMLVSVFIIGLYTLFLILGLKNPFEARFFVPVFGLLTGCTIGSNAHALHIYYMGLYHHNQLYDYLLGNGSTHREATQYFVRRALQAAFNPIMKLMSGVVFVNAPVLMLALVMSGVNIFTAMTMQILLFVMVLAVIVASLFITLMMGRKYHFDKYERLRPITPAAPKAQPTPISGTSANLSGHLHTDSENRQPE